MSEALRPEVVTRSGLVVPPGAQLERRDPTAATRPLVYVSPGMAQVPEWDADAAFRLGYIANVIAYRCVQILANDVASVPLLVSRRYRDRGTVIDGHPLARLLGPPPGGPAPKMSARKLIRWTIAQQIVTGRRAWEIETADGKADGTPTAFWPLVSARLKEIPSESGTEWFRLFEYGRSDRPRRLDPGLVFYGWDPAGLDFRQAESALQAARFDLSLALAADRYGVAFLRNNAVPATVVTTSQFADDKQRRAFRQQWGAEYAGVDNAGRVLFNEVGEGDGPVGDGIDVKALGLSQKDAQLAETRKTALSELAMSIGVPWSKLDASGRTFDNAEVEDRTYWEQRALGLLLDFEDDLNMQVASRFDDSPVLWFDLDTVRALRNKVKPITAAVGAPAMVQAQLITIDEARADYGLPALPDGLGARLMTAEEIQALKGSTAEQIRDALALVEGRGAAGASTREGEGGGRGEPGMDPGPPPVVQTPAAPEPRAVEDPEVRKVRIWRTHDAVVRSMESRWEKAWRRLFARQAKAALARLNGKRGRQLVTALAEEPERRDAADEVFDRAFWLAETAEEAAALLEAVTASGFARVSAKFGVAFDIEAEWAQDFIQARANQLAGQVTETTYSAIQLALAEGVGAGESIPDLAVRVRHVFTVAEEARATVIARTEVVSAFNGSAHLTATQLPGDVVGGQEWIATRDGRVRPEHAEADGQVVAMDAAFTVGGEALAYPGDPGGSPENTVQCRCTVAFLSADEMPERSANPSERRVRYAEMRTLIDLLHPETDLLAFRRAMPVETAA